MNCVQDLIVIMVANNLRFSHIVAYSPFPASAGREPLPPCADCPHDEQASSDISSS